MEGEPGPHLGGRGSDSFRPLHARICLHRLSGLAATVAALEEHGFSVEAADTLDAARTAVLARLPAGSTVMTNTSVTLQETGIADAINDGGPYESARNNMLALDFTTQAQDMKSESAGSPTTRSARPRGDQDGSLVIASASGSQLASYAWGAAQVILVIGAQKLVPDLDAARQRIYGHSLKLEGRPRPGRLRAAQLRREDPSRSTRNSPAASTSCSSGSQPASEHLAACGHPCEGAKRTRQPPDWMMLLCLLPVNMSPARPRGRATRSTSMNAPAAPREPI